MRIVVDINHPGHVHFFKHFIWEMEKKGHEFFVSSIEKDLAYTLLDHYKIKYHPLGAHQTHLIKKMMYMPIQDLQLFTMARDFNPDMFMAIAAIRSSHVAYFLKRPCVSFDDTEHASMQIALYRPFSTAILTPSCFTKYLGPKQRRYNGYHELAYLHPNRFTPDASVLDDLGLAKDEKFALLRFVSWGASHDIIHSGFTDEEKFAVVREVEKYATPVINYEGPLPKELEKYKRHLPPHKMHDALAFASVYVGDGATMASEAVVLGTPAVYTNPLTMGYIQDEEKGKLLTHTGPNVKKTVEATRKYLETSAANIKDAHSKFMADKIDVTAMMMWFVENCPESMKVMEEDKHFDRRFK